MNKYIVAILLLMTGCSTPVPVTPKFPNAPNVLMVRCSELEKLNNDAKLSDIARTLTDNYTSYYECAVKLDSWIEWYETQKKIFEGIK